MTGDDLHVREHVLAALDRLTGLIGAQDMAALNEFDPSPDTVFIGSESWEIIEGPVTRYGAHGMGLSIYIRDPEGNVIELKQMPR